jgi:hypothetical protein
MKLSLIASLVFGLCTSVANAQSQTIPNSHPRWSLGSAGVAAPPGCCKVCSTGKPCGNTCIAAADTCYVGPGCACKGGASESPVLGALAQATDRKRP